mgnify:CR=1 FL=1
MDEIKIRATFILEMLGRPKEHLEETLKRLVERLGEEKGVKIIESKIHEAKKLDIKLSEKDKGDLEKLKKELKDSKNLHVSEDMYTTFAEIDADFDNVDSLLGISFNYMPSNIEITDPQHFVLKKEFIGNILTNTITRLHRYDEIAKKLTLDKTILENKLKELKG